jgi:hypothetical protein
MPLGDSWSDVRCAIVVFSDELSPSQITGELGIQPTRTKERGELTVGGRLTPNHQWGWEVPEGVPASFDDQVDGIRRGVGLHAGKFRSLAGRAHVQFDVLIEHQGRDLYLGWAIDAEVVALIAEFGASLNIDEYDYTDE